jgi:hypothetical protein
MRAKISASAGIPNYGRYIRYIAGRLETECSQPRRFYALYTRAPDKIQGRWLTPSLADDLPLFAVTPPRPASGSAQAPEPMYELRRLNG